MFVSCVRVCCVCVCCVCVCVCVCVCPRPSITSDFDFIYMIGRIISAAFQFRFMALAVDVIDWHGPSNEMRRQLQPKKTKVRLYWPFL